MLVAKPEFGIRCRNLRHNRSYLEAFVELLGLIVTTCMNSVTLMRDCACWLTGTPLKPFFTAVF